MFENMDGSARQAVRKAEKDGVTVEVSQSEAAVREFYDLQCQTRKRHGLPPQPLGFFLNIWRHILSQNQGVVVLASAGRRKNRGRSLFFSRRAGDIQIRRVGFAPAAFAAEQSGDVDGDEMAGAERRDEPAFGQNVAGERGAAQIQAEPRARRSSGSNMSNLICGRTGLSPRPTASRAGTTGFSGRCRFSCPAGQANCLYKHWA